MKKTLIVSLVMAVGLIGAADAASIFYCPPSVTCDSNTIDSCHVAPSSQPLPMASLSLVSGATIQPHTTYPFAMVFAPANKLFDITATCYYGNDSQNLPIMYSTSLGDIVPDTDSGLTQYWGTTTFAACPVNVKNADQSNCPMSESFSKNK